MSINQYEEDLCYLGAMILTKICYLMHSYKFTIVVLCMVIIYAIFSKEYCYTHNCITFNKESQINDIIVAFDCSYYSNCNGLNYKNSVDSCRLLFSNVESILKSQDVKYL